MPTDAFLNDRERGREGQHYVADLLRSKGYPLEEVEDGYFPDFDLKLTTGTTIEVKHDFRSSETGNLALELEALFHSKANILAIVTENPRTVYLAPLQPVLQLANEWPRKVRGGEFNSLMALVPIKTFIEKINPTIFNGN